MIRGHGDVTNAEIASRLEQAADFLEYLGENPFRCRAYRAAARVVSDLSEPIVDIAGARGEGIAGRDGIGTDLAGKIATMAHTNRFPLLEELGSRVPPVACDVMRLPGLGPKKARVLVEHLRLDSLESLAAACREGRVAAIKGFGEKTAATILRQVAFATNPEQQRMLWREADAVVRDLDTWMRGCDAMIRGEAAGSWRRGRETVGTIAYLVATTAPESVIDRFVAWPRASAVVSRNDHGAVVRGPSGVQTAVHVVAASSFGSALVAYTGSPAHVGLLADIAARRGLSLDEHGVLHRRPDCATPTADRSPDDSDERLVYERLGMAWIPPELREGRGEVDAALDGRIPDLVRVDQIRGDLHMHTSASDGEATLAEMARAALARGLQYIAITDHGPRVSMANGLDAERLFQQWEEIDRLNAVLAADGVPPLVVLKGVEVDMLEGGGLDLPDDVLAGADWIVASLHYGQQQPREKITARIIEAIENPHVCVIGHPTGRLIGRRPPYDVDMGAVIAAAARTGTLLEINANPRRLDLDDVHACMAREAGVPLVVSTDAHSVVGLDLMACGIQQARRAGCTARDVANTRSLADLRALIGRP